MKKQTITNIILFSTFTMYISCGENKTADNKDAMPDNNTNSPSTTIEEFTPYVISKTEPYESSQKAQIKCYAYLTTESVTKEQLTGTLNRIYSGLQKYNTFKNFSSPTVIAIYLYVSKNKAENMPESWIAMLSKTPSDTQPQIRFDELKVTALVVANDNEKSADEKKLEFLNDYLRKRNTNLCTIYKTLYDLEGETIRQADIKYPNFGAEHSDYQAKLYKQGKKKIFKQYNINDTLSSYITVFGMNYCK